MMFKPLVSLTLVLALCAASSQARTLLDANTCPVRAERSPHLNSHELSWPTDKEPGGGHHVYVQPTAAFAAFPGGLRTTGCDCAALYSDDKGLDKYACIACKVCSALQTGKFGPGSTCSEAAGCLAPLPVNPSSFYVTCGVDGPYVRPHSGQVTVPADVWATIKDINC